MSRKFVQVRTNLDEIFRMSRGKPHGSGKMGARFYQMARSKVRTSRGQLITEQCSMIGHRIICLPVGELFTLFGAII